MVGAPVSYTGNQPQPQPQPSAPAGNSPCTNYAPPPPHTLTTAPMSTLLPYDGQAPSPPTTGIPYNNNPPPPSSTPLNSYYPYPNISSAFPNAYPGTNQNPSFVHQPHPSGYPPQTTQAPVAYPTGQPNMSNPQATPTSQAPPQYPTGAYPPPPTTTGAYTPNHLPPY